MQTIWITIVNVENFIQKKRQLVNKLHHTFYMNWQYSFCSTLSVDSHNCNIVMTNGMEGFHDNSSILQSGHCNWVTTITKGPHVHSLLLGTL